MPQIQGYLLGSPTGQIQEVTLTGSGTKFYLDTKAQIAGQNGSDDEFIKSLYRGELVVFPRELFTIQQDMLHELKKIRMHLEVQNDLLIKNEDTNGD
jgi:hypothetical protein